MRIIDLNLQCTILLPALVKVKSGLAIHSEDLARKISKVSFFFGGGVGCYKEDEEGN